MAGNRKSRLTDFEIMNEVKGLEFEIFNIFKNVPKTYKGNLIQQTYDNLHGAKLFLAKCLNMHPYSKAHVEYKRDMLEESFAYIKLIECDLYQMNDLGAVGNNAIVGITMRFYDTEKNYDKFISSLNRKIGSMEDE